MDVSSSSDALQAVTKYNWQLGDWSSYITGYQSNPSTILNTAVEIYLDNYAPFSQIIQIYAENACGTDMIMATGKMFYTDDYGGYIIMAPNPADSYVELSFFANRELTDKDNVSQNKNCIRTKRSKKAKMVRWKSFWYKYWIKMEISENQLKLTRKM